MAAQTQTTSEVSESPVQPSTFERFAGVCAILVSIGGILYAIAFVVLKSTLLSSLFLLLGGVLSTAVLTTVYNRLRKTDVAFSLWAFLLSGVGALGAAVHGGYELANGLHPVKVTGDLSNFLANSPNSIDPRGLLTFGLAGLGLFVIAWLIGRGKQFPRGLGYLGYLAAVLLIVLYLARLILLTPTNPLILGTAVLSGFIVNPLWYIWLGVTLLRGR